MKYYSVTKAAILVALLTIICVSAYPQTAYLPSDKNTAKSEWVYISNNGVLQYKTTERGDKIMDFSYAGYMGGGVAIPMVETRIILKPISGDNTAMIQDAINKVSQLPLKNGFRGAVLLSAGTYNCLSTIKIDESGVVLRGSGSAENGSVIQMTGQPHVCIMVNRRIKVNELSNPVKIVDPYVPSGTKQFSVEDARHFKKGDLIRITKSVTANWIKFMGMDNLVRNGKKQTWLNGTITTDRKIENIIGNKIIVSVPLADNFDKTYLDPPGITVVKIKYENELSQIGIEHLRIVASPQSGTINQRHDKAFTLSGMIDGWANDIQIFNTVNSISVTGTRITVAHVNVVHEVATLGAAKPADINGSGSQLLFNDCHIQCNNVFFFGTGPRVTGPNVLLNCIFNGEGWIQPHQRWATGLLVDNCKVPQGGIDFMNRGEYGSGHGWAIGWAVAWNCIADSYTNQMPPGAYNWVIGSKGKKVKRSMPFNKEPDVPQGVYDSYQQPVAPVSLYLAQLKQRLGEKALKNIGY